MENFLFLFYHVFLSFIQQAMITLQEIAFFKLIWHISGLVDLKNQLLQEQSETSGSP